MTATATATKVEAQQRIDQIDTELSELYRRVRDKEAERAEYDRILNPHAWTTVIE